MEFFKVKTFQDLSNSTAEGEAALLGAVLSAMCLAMAANTFTSGAVSTGSASVAACEYVISELLKLGYAVSTGSATITVTWY